MSFVAAKVDNVETRQLIAYGQIMLMLAKKYGGLGWRSYDTHFRQLSFPATASLGLKSIGD
jgi:hypothetical protein